MCLCVCLSVTVSVPVSVLYVYMCVSVLSTFFMPPEVARIFFPLRGPPPPNHFCNHGLSLMNVYIVFQVTTAISVKANFNLKFACVIGGMPRVRCWWLKSESTRGQALWASWSTTETYILRSSSDYFGWWEYL